MRKAPALIVFVLIIVSMPYGVAARSFGVMDTSQQYYRPKIQKIVNELDSAKRLDYESVGFGGETTDTYLAFKSLSSKATIEELVRLTDHENPIIRGYAAWGLVDRKYPALSTVLLKFLQHDQFVSMINGCIAGRQMLSAILYYKIKWQPKYARDTSFYLDQRRQCVRQVINTCDNGSLLEDALLCNGADEKTYARIRGLVMLNPTSESLTALACYHKQEDIKLIRAAGSKGFMAIAAFPDSIAWGTLLEFKDSEKSLAYFQSIAAYKNSAANDLLTEIYTTCDSQQCIRLDEALVDYYCPIFRALILQIFSEKQVIDLATTKVLIHDSPEEAAIYFARGLSTGRQPVWQEWNNHYGTKDSILPLMLDIITHRNATALHDIYSKGILYWYGTDLYSLLDHASKAELRTLLPELLQRISSVRYPYELFAVTEAVFSCSKESTQKVMDYLNTKKDRWDEGNWGEAFRKLFRKYKIKY